MSDACSMMLGRFMEYNTRRASGDAAEHTTQLRSSMGQKARNMSGEAACRGCLLGEGGIS